MIESSDHKPEFLSAKELAMKLKRSVWYVYAMRRQGFRMIGGRTTVEAAMIWLERNPHPHQRKPKNLKATQ